MADTEREVQTTFTVKDLTSKVLGQMSVAADRFGKRVDTATMRLVGMAKSYGALAGVVGIGATVAKANRYVDQIANISVITGQAVNKTAGIVEALETAGIEGHFVEGIMLSMSKKADGAARGMGGMGKLARRLGLDMKKGPESTLLQMSKLVEKNKLGTGQMTQLLGINRKTSADMMDLLAQGPAALSKALEEGRKKNAHINQETIAAYKKFEEATHRVGISWRRLGVIVLSKLYPALDKLASALDSRFDSWAVAAGKFGDFLVDHMEEAIAAAKVFGKIMLANYAAMKLTGGGLIGLPGRIGKGISKARSGVGRAAAAVGTAAMTNPVSILQSALAIVMKIAGGFLKLGLIAGLVAVVIAGIKTVLNNVGGVKDRITALLSTIWARMKDIVETMKVAFSEDAPLGKLLRWLGTGLAAIFEGVLSAVNRVVYAVQILTEMASGLARFEWVSPSEARKVVDARMSQAKYENDLNNRYEKILAGRKKLLDQRNIPKERGGAVVNQDFRGSKFDITQAFAEGFDPDRIAVTFANDLSSLGERKLQSGLSPVFAVR